MPQSAAVGLSPSVIAAADQVLSACQCLGRACGTAAAPAPACLAGEGTFASAASPPAETCGANGMSEDISSHLHVVRAMCCILGLLLQGGQHPSIHAVNGSSR